jgi:3-ketosteroid 9alpha-monooxygenase subunit A
MFGKDLVLFRGGDGALGLLDAYCPHLGAHLGVGGSVSADGCIQCPFHGWKFGTDGKCKVSLSLLCFVCFLSTPS